ncbi:MAG: ribose-phosphate pyrophosphokinase [Myxococcales bacterium]|nr:ribose-phosphate pyrophosphokinase [Myxococcales bacterium]MCB9519982.1 ribose-phosphate pyrophosphokinase [Myxococcales bacterium]MCB9533107.1 ribose-phosphate pyrophosphokinase [Myxococcales bacterium]
MPQIAGESVKLFTGNANPELAREVADYLALPLGEVTIGRFADGEVRVVIGESVRGKHVYVIQSLCKPVNDNVMELLVMIDALRRSSSKSITAVLPYYAYARQDRQDRPRTPITARLVADLLRAAGVDRVMAMDLHAQQIQGFFSVPVEHLYGTKNLIQVMRSLAPGEKDDCVVVAPDAGGVERARFVSNRLGVGLAIIDKRRPRPNVSEVMHVIGEVAGKHCFIVDDMIDTAGTLCSAAKALKEGGARDVFAFATHGLLNGPAVERIEASELSAVYVSNTVPLSEAARECSRINLVGVGDIIGEAISRVQQESSVSSLWV